jgi:PEGA domain
VGTAGGVIQLVTRCASAEEFIERFARYTTATDVIVPALPNLTVGATGPFVICLTDRSIILKGRCEVTEIRRAPVTAGAALGPALMRLHLREIDAHSAGIHLRLMERQASAHRAPALPGVTSSPPRDAVPAAAPVAADASEATVVSDAGSRSDSEPTAISARPRPEVRVPGAALTLPANPLGDLDAADLASFIDLSLLETSAVEAAPPALAARAETRQDRARRIARRMAPYAACAAAMLSLGIALGWASKAAPVAAAAVVSPPPQAAPTAPASSSVQAPPDGDPIPATRNCVARVTTQPAGAAVFWGDTALGSSPIQNAAVPCGTATVTLRREHFAEITRTITADRARDTIVTERLRRPPAKLMVTSSPPRAFIRLNKRRIGPTPREIDTPRFERVRIEASLPGYRRWKKTLYVKEAESEVDVRLVRAPSPIARRAPAPPTAPTRAAPPATGPAGPLAVR